MEIKWHSKVMKKCDGTCGCVVCPFTNGDHSEAAMMQVLEALDSVMNADDTWMETLLERVLEVDPETRLRRTKERRLKAEA